MKSTKFPKWQAMILATVAAVMTAAGHPVNTLQDLQKLEGKVSAVAAKTLPATEALLSDETGSSGSGVVTTADGLILTAAHVIQGAKEVLVVFPDGKQVPGKVLGANLSKDIGMVKIDEPGPWPFIDRGGSKGLSAGDWVVALGHSAGFDPARTPPVRFGRVVSKGPGNFLTTDCTLIGGDSGGPLFDLEGRIVAIHSSIGVSWKNNNHAGVDGFVEDWDALLEGKVWGRLEMNPLANPEMPVMGIEMGVGRGPGVPVMKVYPRSPAAKAGVRAGDVVVSLDGGVVRNGQDLMLLLAKRLPGDVVAAKVVRDGREIELELALAQRAELFEEP